MEKVSVIMGIYNCADTLGAAVDSIMNQTYENIELIMCDDGSSDNTYSEAEKYRDRYPEKITLLRNEKNMYLSATLNHCLEHATGYYVARMDADDISLPDRIEKQVVFLEQHPEYQLVGSSMILFDENGDGSILKRVEKPDKFALRYGTVFSHPTIMTYKSVYDALGGYTVSDRTVRGQDYDLWFRFYANGYKGYNIQEPLYRFREDINAIKRRTVKGRINNYRTTIIGFKLLKYPLAWYIRPTVELLKCFVPAKVQFLYGKIKRRTKIA